MNFKISNVVIFFTIFLSFAGLMVVSPLRAQEVPNFISAIDDLPLMDGLIEDKESATLFETALGRFIEVFASGVIEQDRLLAFYDKTLPQLGWRRESPGLFQREGETLSIEFPKKVRSFTGSPSILTVGFRIKPSVN